MSYVFPFTSASFILEGIFLSVFAYNRFYEYHRSPNYVTRQYWLASLCVSLALFVYGLPAVFTSNHAILSPFATAALLINAIGFSNFFLIPLNVWLRPSRYILAKYGLYLFVVALAACMIIDPPMTMMTGGIVHWRFGPLIGTLAAMHMDIAFALNIVLLGLHFYRFKGLPALNAILLIITFTLTGLGGTYLYMGDVSHLLALASISLCMGIGAIFFSVVRGSIAKLLNWQYR